MARSQFHQCGIDGVFGAGGAFHRCQRFREGPTGVPPCTHCHHHPRLGHRGGGGGDSPAASLLVGRWRDHCPRWLALFPGLRPLSAFLPTQQPLRRHAQVLGKHAHTESGEHHHVCPRCGVQLFLHLHRRDGGGGSGHRLFLVHITLQSGTGIYRYLPQQDVVVEKGGRTFLLGGRLPA